MGRMWVSLLPQRPTMSKKAVWARKRAPRTTDTQLTVAWKPMGTLREGGTTSTPPTLAGRSQHKRLTVRRPRRP